MVTNNDLTLDDATLASANRAFARFNLAERFKGICVDGIGERTARGYSAAIRVFLAYTAAEQIGITTGRRVTCWQIIDSELSQNLKPLFEQPSMELEEHFSRDGVRGRLKRWLRADDFYDVRPAATAIRISVAHGSLTAWGFNASKRGNFTALTQLAEAVLTESDRQFSNWINERLESS